LLEITIDCLYFNKTPSFLDNKNGLSAFQKVMLKKKKKLVHWRDIVEVTGRQTGLTVTLF